jgi:hypothetical protein
VLEVLKRDREATEIARAYNIHPVTLVAQYEKKIRELEQLLGRKEVEIALLRLDHSSSAVPTRTVETCQSSVQAAVPYLP